MDYLFHHPRFRHTSVRYAAAVGAALIGMALRIPLTPFLGRKLPYITFFLATALSSMIGGFGPGLVTTFLGLLLVVFFVLPFGRTWDSFQAEDYLGIGVFLIVSSLISWLAAQLREARNREELSRLHFQQTLVSIGDAVISTDADSRIVFMNQVAEELSGWTFGEAKGRHVQDVFRIFKEGTEQAVESPVDKVLQTGHVVGLANHTDLVTKSGDRIPIDDSGAPVRSPDGKMLGVVLVFRDIRARREAEVRLQAAERRARTIVESITDGFFHLDHQWNFTYVNAEAEKALAIPASELLGKNFWDIHPEAKDTRIGDEYRYAVANCEPVFFENYYEPHQSWYEIFAYPSQDGLSIYFRNVSERKCNEAALEKLNEDLKQFTYAATHDIREPVRVMMSYAQLLEQEMGSTITPELKMYVDQIVKGGDRITRLVTGLLEFSMLSQPEEELSQPIDSGMVLKQALEDLKIPLEQAKAKIIVGELPPVLLHPSHLYQIFQNLVGNAIKYRRDGIPPVIQVSVERIADELVFSVKDNGIGIPSDYLSKIFIPFRRLHGPEIEGAGIGLATCTRIVERYGGRIWVESGLGEGSTFYFSLQGVESNLAASASAGGSGT